MFVTRQISSWLQETLWEDPPPQKNHFLNISSARIQALCMFTSKHLVWRYQLLFLQDAKNILGS